MGPADSFEDVSVPQAVPNRERIIDVFDDQLHFSYTSRLPDTEEEREKKTAVLRARENRFTIPRNQLGRVVGMAWKIQQNRSVVSEEHEMRNSQSLYHFSVLWHSVASELQLSVLAS